ncbi:hypothetical protein [Nocardioides sp. R-C-SC26]|nr:hypothetical protein [Nocardioides sp. R-C-SC26]
MSLLIEPVRAGYAVDPPVSVDDVVELLAELRVVRQVGAELGLDLMPRR